MPIVAMDQLGAQIEQGDRLEDRLAEERVSFTIVLVILSIFAVELWPIEIVILLYKKEWYGDICLVAIDPI